MNNIAMIVWIALLLTVGFCFGYGLVEVVELMITRLP